MTRIFGMPAFWPSLDMARDFSTIGRTLPGLQYMISRMRSIETPWLIGSRNLSVGLLIVQRAAAWAHPVRRRHVQNTYCSCGVAASVFDGRSETGARAGIRSLHISATVRHPAREQSSDRRSDPPHVLARGWHHWRGRPGGTWGAAGFGGVCG